MTEQERDAQFDEGREGGGAVPAQEPPAPSSETASDDMVAKYRREAEENHDKYLRALAELENVQKRARKDRSELLKYAGEQIVADLLQVLDNLELALNHAQGDPASLQQGVQLIHKMFIETLAKWEVKSLPVVGKEFDPASCEAISRVPANDVAPGVVIKELRKAFTFKDKIIRPGAVVVAMAPEPGSESSTS